MFKITTLNVLAKIGVGICIFGALLSLVLSFMDGGTKLAFYPLLSWLLLAYSCYCAMRLTKLELYDEDVKTLGWSIYILFIIFILFLIVGLSISPIISFLIAARLHWQKNTIEKWTKDNE